MSFAVKRFTLTICLTAGLLGLSAFGQVDAQWRGPNRDGVYPDENLLKEWPAQGPRLIWSTEGLGDGYSSPAVTDDRAYVTGMSRGRGFLFAFDREGKLLWKSSYGREWNGSRPGARTTPTVAGDRIYVMSAMGRAVCFDNAGKIVWAVNLEEKFWARNLQWGMTESLLVDGDRVFCTPGGPDFLAVILDRHTGKTLQKIKGNEEKSGYCSPCLVTHGNRRLLLTMSEGALVGIDADSGNFLWEKSHVTDYGVNANTPLYHDGHIYTVSGYGTGGQMFELSEDGTQAKRIWVQRTLDSQMGAVVLVDGSIYGSGHNGRGWHCLDWRTGKIRWTARALGNKGAVIFSDGMIYCYSERGDVGLVRPDPEGFDVVSSFRISRGTGEHWAHPVIKDGRLYIRHGNSLMVYDIAAQ